ncbi:hypothetical protein CSUI_006720 [Cystoisospora suis]|uniref:Transmembrane protein n=1 Tax=Cystoisospora suis TaxID=483139 RepID=A0A2C6KSJ4_9APIC|nr:hypothetical protein CSUI_006720 [Cystoisospora suis]
MYICIYMVICMHACIYVYIYVCMKVKSNWYLRKKYLSRCVFHISLMYLSMYSNLSIYLYIGLYMYR